MHRAKGPIRGVRVHLDTVNQLSAVREVVNCLTSDSQYYSKAQRESLTAEYVAEFENCLVSFLSADSELENRKWKFYFVKNRDALERALGDIEKSER